MTEKLPEEIAAGLTEQERRTVSGMSGAWQAGPLMEEDMHPDLKPLRGAGLVEREFGDMSEPSTTKTEDGLSIALSACWWFRLTPLGLQIRALLNHKDS